MLLFLLFSFFFFVLFASSHLLNGIVYSGQSKKFDEGNMSTKDLKEMDSDQRLEAQEQRLASAAFHSSVAA